jgi:hypothetical protein
LASTLASFFNRPLESGARFFHLKLGHHFSAVTVVIFPKNLLFRERLARKIVLQDKLNIRPYFLNAELEKVIDGTAITQLQDVIDLFSVLFPNVST